MLADSALGKLSFLSVSSWRPSNGLFSLLFFLSLLLLYLRFLLQHFFLDPFTFTIFQIFPVMRWHLIAFIVIFLVAFSCILALFGLILFYGKISFFDLFTLTLFPCNCILFIFHYFFGIRTYRNHVIFFRVVGIELRMYCIKPFDHSSNKLEVELGLPGRIFE